MKYTYNTNCMGPYGLWWYEENKIPYTIKISNNKFTNFQDHEQKVYEQWYGGRIDVYSGSGYPDELGLPIMSGESYARFSRWLLNFTSDDIKSFYELRQLFEESEDYKLAIFEEI